MGETGMSLGDLLRRLRSAAALSQEELAERAGLSRHGISDLERGARQAPRLETVRMLADALGLGVDDRAALLKAARPAVLHAGTAEPETRAHFSVPAPLTRMIGREAEVHALRTIVPRDDVRLVTLTGAGGTGKTRLAIAVATEMVDTFPDGVCYVDLSPLTDPELVVPTIAASLGVPEVAGQPPCVQTVSPAARQLRADPCGRAGNHDPLGHQSRFDGARDQSRAVPCARRARISGATLAAARKRSPA
jgi:transcriptional regulator with XRE-family HTH domain